MTKWWKRLLVAGGLMALGHWTSTASAQFPPNPGWQAPAPTPYGGMPNMGHGAHPAPQFAADPKPHMAPDFPNVAPASHEAGTFSITNDGSPNAFSEDDRPCYANPYGFILRGEWLAWQFPKGRIPVTLVTSSSNPNPFNSFGALGQDGTTLLLGPGNYDYDLVNGPRVTIGMACGVIPPWELSGFYFNKDIDIFRASGDGSNTAQVLSRPVLASQLPNPLNTGQETVFTSSFPGLVAGNISVVSDLNIWGIESNWFFNIGQTEKLMVDFLVGYRYLEVNERFTIQSSALMVDPVFTLNFNTARLPQGFRTLVTDDFYARNRFHGGNIGFRTLLNGWRFNLMVDTKLAIGANQQTMDITGSSLGFTPAGGAHDPVTVQGGILAAGNNLGRQSKSEFTIVPELNANLGFMVSTHIRLVAGYSLFWMSNAVRPADQLDNVIDTRSVPTDAAFTPGFTGQRPTRTLRTTDFWGHGVNFGIELTF